LEPENKKNPQIYQNTDCPFENDFVD